MPNELNATFDDGSKLILPITDIRSNFIPTTVRSHIPKPSGRRKRPTGPSMTPYHVRDDVVEYLDAYLKTPKYTEGKREASGWFYTQPCSGTSGPQPAASSYPHTVRRDGLLGGGGIGTDWLYLQALRLKGYDSVPINVSNIGTRNLKHHYLLDSDGKPMSEVLADAIDYTQRKTAKKTLDAYDALTEFAERTKTINTILSILRGVIKPISTLRRVAAQLKAKPSKTLAEMGLSYEYGIRPIIQSAEQISKIVNNQGKFRIQKSTSKSLQFTTDPAIPTSGLRLYDHGVINVKIKSSSYYHHSDELGRVTDAIRVNPFVTAWELIPYSFVIDWFISVGDWLVFNTSQLSQIGANALFCTSVRVNGFYETVLESGQIWIPEQTYTAQFTDTWANNTCFQQGGPEVKGAGIVTLNLKRSLPGEALSGVRSPFIRTTLNSYERFLYRPSDLPIEISSPFEISKRHLLDAIMLVVVRLKS